MQVRSVREVWWTFGRRKEKQSQIRRLDSKYSFGYGQRVSKLRILYLTYLYTDDHGGDSLML